MLLLRRPHFLIMKYLVCLLIIMGFAWACTSASGEGASVAAPDGHEIYKTYCVSCHGVNGDMGVSGAFDLSASSLTAEERIQVITNGRNAMTSFQSLLSPEKIHAVAEYTLDLKDK